MRRRAVRLVGLVLIVVLAMLRRRRPAAPSYLAPTAEGKRAYLAELESNGYVTGSWAPPGADPARFRMPVLGQLGDPDELYRVTVVPRRRVRHGR